MKPKQAQIDLAPPSGNVERWRVSDKYAPPSQPVFVLVDHKYWFGARELGVRKLNAEFPRSNGTLRDDGDVVVELYVPRKRRPASELNGVHK